MDRSTARLLVVSLTGVFGCAVVALAAPWQAGLQGVLFLGLSAALEAFPARLSDRHSVSLSLVAVLVGVVVGGAPLAVAAAVGSAVVIVARVHDARVQRATFNIGMMVVAAAAGAWTFELVAGTPALGIDAVEAGPWIGAIIAASIVHAVVNLSLLAAVVSTTGVSARDAIGMVTSTLWTQPASWAMAIVAYVVLANVGLAALALVMVPLVAARRAMLAVDELRDRLDHVVLALVRLVEVKDGYTRGHADRVARLSDRVAQELGLSAEERHWIRIGAVLHDVGKIIVPHGVLTKPGWLDDDEAWEMRRHPDVGADLLAEVEALAPALHIVRCHHERPDGTGYPRGMVGDDIDISTRIVSAVDAWDAMTTTRPYRKALSVDEAVAQLQQHAGTQFDARVVATLVELVAPSRVRAPERSPQQPARFAGLARVGAAEGGS